MVRVSSKGISPRDQSDGTHILIHLFVPDQSKVSNVDLYVVGALLQGLKRQAGMLIGVEERVSKR